MSLTAETVRQQLALFNSVAPLRVPAFAIINAIQDSAPRDQVLAIATTLSAVCSAIGVNAHDILIQIARAKHHIDGPFETHYRAIEAYAKGELLGGAS